MKSLVVGFLFFLLFVPPVFAQQEELEINTITPTPIPAVEYTLPYPGILPNNPLYPLKAARDRIVSFFISDPQKRAEFDLLQADKRLQAGLFLLHEDNPDVSLALTTISKGQNYYEEALVAVQEARQEKADALLGGLIDRLVKSARKQRELLMSERKQAEPSKRDDFTVLIKRSDGFITSARQLRREE